MSDHPHHDPIEENIETHPVQLAIGVVIGAAALIIGILMLAPTSPSVPTARAP